MNREQYEAYRAADIRPQEIHISDLGPEEGTLAYGYDTDRNTWHIYVMDNELHVLIYWPQRVGQEHRYHTLRYLHGEAIPAEMMSPNKRVYPDTVDPKFAELMRRLGSPLNFIGMFDWDSEQVQRRNARGAFRGRTHFNIDYSTADEDD